MLFVQVFDELHNELIKSTSKSPAPLPLEAELVHSTLHTPSCRCEGVSWRRRWPRCWQETAVGVCMGWLFDDGIIRPEHRVDKQLECHTLAYSCGQLAPGRVELVFVVILALRLRWLCQIKATAVALLRHSWSSAFVVVALANPNSLLPAPHVHRANMKVRLGWRLSSKSRGRD